MYDEPIYFVDYKKTDNVDEYGDPICEEVKTLVFGQILSITQTEFYQAQSVGIKPELKVQIPDYLEYNEQQYVVFGNVRYSILRTFRDCNTDSLELVLYGGVRNATAEISNTNN